jgi:hypothetical protein
MISSTQVLYLNGGFFYVITVIGMSRVRSGEISVQRRALAMHDDERARVSTSPAMRCLNNLWF